MEGNLNVFAKTELQTTSPSPRDNQKGMAKSMENLHGTGPDRTKYLTS